MKSRDPHIPAPAEPDLKKLDLYLCLVPVFGTIPAVLTLVRKRHSHPQAKETARVAIALFLLWLVAYSTTGSPTGSPTGDTFQASAEILKGSTGILYLMSTFWLMLRTYQNKSVKLPISLPHQSPSISSPDIASPDMSSPNISVRDRPFRKKPR